MLTINAADAKNEWGAVVDSVIREKPKFIMRTGDCMFLSNIENYGFQKNTSTARLSLLSWRR